MAPIPPLPGRERVGERVGLPALLRDAEPRGGAAHARRLHRVVVVLLGRRAEPLVRLFEGALGAIDVDLLAPLGRVGEDDDAVLVDLEEAAADGVVLSRPPVTTVSRPGSSADMKLAWPGRMPKPPCTPGARTSSQVSCATRRSGVTISRLRGMAGYPAASFFAFSTASSMVPTM